MWSYSSILMFALDVLISPLWNKHHDVPWVPTAMSTVHRMLEMAEVGPDDLVYDLGCGDGRLMVTAARYYGARAVGIELDPLRYLWCQALITALRLRKRVRIIRGSFFTQDLSDADVIACYLLPSVNQDLETKLKEELRPETRVVSHYFTFPGLHRLRMDPESRIYLYDLEA